MLVELFGRNPEEEITALIDEKQYFRLGLEIILWSNADSIKLFAYENHGAIELLGFHLNSLIEINLMSVALMTSIIVAHIIA